MEDMYFHSSSTNSHYSIKGKGKDETQVRMRTKRNLKTMNLCLSVEMKTVGLTYFKSKAMFSKCCVVLMSGEIRMIET